MCRAGLIADNGVTIELRQSKYLTNFVEQDPMVGFKSF
jgi:hypothetical protein